MKQIINFNTLFLLIIFLNQFLIAQNQDSTEFEKTLKKYKLKAKDLEINVEKPEFFYIGCINMINCYFTNYKMRKKFSFVVTATKCLVTSNFYGSFDLNPMSNMTNVKIGIIHKDEIKYKGEVIDLLSYNIPCKNPPNPNVNFYQNDIIFTEYKDSLPIDYIRIVLWPDSIFNLESKCCYSGNLRQFHYLFRWLL